MVHDRDAPVATSAGSSPHAVSLLVTLASAFWLALGALAQWAPALAQRVQYSKALGLLCAALLFPIVTALGRRLLRRFCFTLTTAAEQFVASAALGLGVLAYLIFGLAALHELHPIVVAALLAALTAAFGPHALRLAVRAAQGAMPAAREALRDPIARAAALLVAVALVIALLGALVPATDSEIGRAHV